MKPLLLAYFGVVAILSCAAFLAYGWDKRQAIKGRWRTPEKTLHLLALFGGWPGALFAQHLFRHKTQKLRFRVVFWLCVVLHLAAVAGTLAIVYTSHS